MDLKSFFQELKESDGAGVGMTDKQISIISTAIEIFSEKGYSATSTSEIAKKAGVGEGTIFHHYKTKKDMLLAIPDYLSKSSLSKDFMEDLTRIFDNPYERFEDFLKAVIYNRRSFVKKNIPLIKVLFQEVPLHPELRNKITDTILLPNMGKLLQAIDKFREKGEIIDIPSASVVKLIVASVFGYFFTHYIVGFEFEEDHGKELDYLIRYISHGLCTTNASANNDE